jgi:hypothetical protein
VAETRLIVDRNEREELTANRETDARTALTRGLAEYIATLQIEAPGGRHQAFAQVFDTWPEQEEIASYPSAAVYAVDLASYDASQFTPSVGSKVAVTGGQFLLAGTEFVLPILLDVWAQDPEQRQILVAMIEDAFVPVDWRYGPLLELPHYFGARGAYELMQGGYIDDEIKSQQRVRRAHFQVTGRVRMHRIATFAEAKPQARIAVSEQEATTPNNRLSF